MLMGPDQYDSIHSTVNNGGLVVACIPCTYIDEPRASSDSYSSLGVATLVTRASWLMVRLVGVGPVAAMPARDRTIIGAHR